ncbi:MAG TPA: fatty acid desaturase [Steroidobacteraceae bacterium]|nr:fatty acid desaturase [Steroidobacteraceae bacterium]
MPSAAAAAATIPEPQYEGSTAWIRQASDMVSDLLPRSAPIYWTDFLLSVTSAWLLAFYWFRAPLGQPLTWLALLGAAILFFRAGTFIHEIVHFRNGELRWFARFWNAALGIPLLMPWILYRNHVEHHSVRYFGTPEDGEYLPLASAPPVETVKYVLQTPLLPVLTVLRFGIGAPLSWFHRGLREWLLTVASAAVINPYYRKRFPKSDERHLLIVEILCFAWLVVLAVLLAKGVITWVHVARAYALLAVALGLNWFRNLAAHKYGNYGERMTLAEQLGDSINITGQTWLTVLMFPVGLRYHALHHLLPGLPYHNLGKAHKRLTERLPANCPYHATSCNSYFAAAGALWRGALHTSKDKSAVDIWRSRIART